MTSKSPNAGETSQQFLERIGPRELTAEEARSLHILRLREGKGTTTGVSDAVAMLAQEADLKKEK